MARRSTPCTQADMTRLIKAVMAAGMDQNRIAGIRLTKDGAEILFGDPKRAQNDNCNPWDEVLEQ